MEQSKPSESPVSGLTRSFSDWVLGVTNTSQPPSESNIMDASVTLKFPNHATSVEGSGPGKRTVPKSSQKNSEVTNNKAYELRSRTLKRDAVPGNINLPGSANVNERPGNSTLSKMQVAQKCQEAPERLNRGGKIPAQLACNGMSNRKTEVRSQHQNATAVYENVSTINRKRQAPSVRLILQSERASLLICSALLFVALAILTHLIVIRVKINTENSSKPWRALTDDNANSDDSMSFMLWYISRSSKHKKLHVEHLSYISELIKSKKNFLSNFSDEDARKLYRVIQRRDDLVARYRSSLNALRCNNCSFLRMKSFNHSWYYFSNWTTDWSTASKFCHSFNATLVSLLSAAENSFVHNQLISFNLNDTWIGLYFNSESKKNDANRTWHWDGAEKSVSNEYRNWNTNEPNNNSNKGNSNVTEDCVHFFRNQDKWNDVPCSEKNGFVCQWRPIPVLRFE